MTNANLADAVELLASPCLQRVKRLESVGYVTGYGAQINPAKLTESIPARVGQALAAPRV